MKAKRSHLAERIAVKNPVERHRNVPTSALENMQRHALSEKAEWERIAKDARERLAVAERAVASQTEWLAELDVVLTARETEGATVG